jgi:predicted transcriptional regulator
MVGDAAPLSEDVLEDTAYLSRSANRLRILEVIATAPHVPRAIADETDIPRSTLRRILTEIVERGWAERTLDGEYIATRTGEVVAAETGRYVGAIRAIRVLGDTVAWLPTEELTIGLRYFEDATVRRPEPNAMSAPSTFATELMREATEFACLVNVPPSLAFEQAMVGGVIDGRLRTEHVITDDELAVLRENPERSSRWQAYIEAGADLYCYDGPIPCNLFVIDETVLILDRQPEAPESFESTDAVVRSWAQEVIEDHREDAERLDTPAFARESMDAAGGGR